MSGTQNSRDVISLDERIQMIRNAKATSPQVAAAKFKQIANMSVADIVASDKDIDFFIDALGDYAEDSSWDIDHYGEYCKLYAKMHAGVRFTNALLDEPSADSCFVMTPGGINYINSMVIIALLFLERIKKSGKKNSPSFYYCFNMSLEDFWNAAIHTCVKKDGSLDLKRVERIQSARDNFMRDRNYNDSLKKVLADLLCEDQRCYGIFGHLDHIMNCNNDLNNHLRNTLPVITFSKDDSYEDEYPGLIKEESLYDDVEVPLDDQYLYDTNPKEYYLQYARDYTAPKYDFHDDSVTDVRYEILLGRPSYSENALKQLSKSIDNKEFRDLLDHVVSSEAFRVYKCMIGHCANQIYQLLVVPFINSLAYEYTDSIEE